MILRDLGVIILSVSWADSAVLVLTRDFLWLGGVQAFGWDPQEKTDTV